MNINFEKIYLKIEGKNVDRIGKGCNEESFKFVGHHLDEFMSWDHHISHVKNKISKTNYVINSSKNFVPLQIRKLLYNSLFRSHLEFGIIAWGGVKSKQLQPIVNLQKKCIRNVANKDFRSHTDPIFKSLNIMKFSDLYEYNCILFMHRYAYARHPCPILNTFTPLSVNNRTGNYLLQKYKYIFFDKFPSVSLLKIWNEQTPEIKNCISLSSVKLKVTQKILEKYNDKVKCNYINCPDCH